MGAGRPAERGTLDRVLRLDIRRLHRDGALAFVPNAYRQLTYHFSDGWGREFGSFGCRVQWKNAELTLEVSWTARRENKEPEHINRAVSVQWTRCNYGGRRPWLTCSCGRRVAVLYIVHPRLVCRACSGFT